MSRRWNTTLDTVAPTTTVDEHGGEGCGGGDLGRAAGDERLERAGRGSTRLAGSQASCSRCSNGPAQAMPTARATGTERTSTARAVPSSGVAR